MKKEVQLKRLEKLQDELADLEARYLLDQISDAKYMQEKKKLKRKFDQIVKNMERK